MEERNVHRIIICNLHKFTTITLLLGYSLIAFIQERANIWLIITCLLASLFALKLFIVIRLGKENIWEKRNIYAKGIIGLIGLVFIITFINITDNVRNNVTAEFYNDNTDYTKIELFEEVPDDVFNILNTPALYPVDLSLRIITGAWQSQISVDKALAQLKDRANTFNSEEEYSQELLDIFTDNGLQFITERLDGSDMLGFAEGECDPFAPTLIGMTYSIDYCLKLNAIAFILLLQGIVFNPLNLIPAIIQARLREEADAE